MSMRYPSDMVADLWPARDVPPGLDNNAREVGAEDAPGTTELPVDVCRADETRHMTDNVDARFQSEGFWATAMVFTRISLSAMTGTGCSLTET